jgi:hypothetical protein
MGYYDADVYYQPEKFDLTPVAEVDFSDGNYCFDYRVVWRHSSGVFYTARDSGCSCPSPFEDYTKLEDLDKLDLAVLEVEVADELKCEYGCGDKATYADFLRKVQDAVTG